jgi:hypothetical protein
VTLIDLIDRLAEPAEPAPVSMMPQTVGWAVLGALAALVLTWLVVRAVRHWRADAYRRAALKALDGAGDDPAAVSEILRRAALVAYGRPRVASLHGAEWLAFLDRTGGGFASGPGTALAVAPWRSDPAPVKGLGDVAARWVRRHRRPAEGAAP